MNLPSGLEGMWTPALFWIVLAVGLGVGFFLRGRLGETASAEDEG